MKKYILLTFILISNFSFACSCAELLPMKKAIQQADVVFTGKILSKESLTAKDGELSDYLKTQVNYKVLVTTMHKGKVKNKILTVLTGPASGGDCGYGFKIGSSYTIFTYTHPVIIKGKTVNKFLTTSICTRTQKFEKTEYNKIVKYCKSKGYC